MAGSTWIWVSVADGLIMVNRVRWLANGWVNWIWVSGYGEADYWIVDLGRLGLRIIVSWVTWAAIPWIW